MLKKLVIIACFCLFSSLAYADDMPWFDLDLDMAADSSDSAIQRDTTYSEVYKIEDWPALTWNFKVTDDGVHGDKTDDTVFIILQTAYDKNGTWFHPKMAADSVILLPGAADTTLYIKKVIIKDSLYDFIRFMGIYSITPGATVAADSAGLSYTWRVKPFICRTSR